MRRLNVQEQNSVTRAAIADVARRFRLEPLNFPHLLAELNARGLDPRTGILAELSIIPEQCGDFMSGRWVTADRGFVYFEIQLNYRDPTARTVEAWNALAHHEPNAHVPGTGKNFEYLALEVLNELQSQSNNSLQRP